MDDCVFSAILLSVCRLADDLVNYILKLAVKDSCMLLSNAQSCCSDQAAFDALICNVPVSILSFPLFPWGLFPILIAMDEMSGEPRHKE